MKKQCFYSLSIDNEKVEKCIIHYENVGTVAGATFPTINYLSTKYESFLKLMYFIGSGAYHSVHLKKVKTTERIICDGIRIWYTRAGAKSRLVDKTRTIFQKESIMVDSYELNHLKTFTKSDFQHWKSIAADFDFKIYKDDNGYILFV